MRRQKHGPPGTPLKKDSPFDTNLKTYIRRRRAGIFGFQLIWLGVIAIACVFGRRFEFHRIIFVAGGSLAALIIARTVWLLFRRHDRIAAAMEIEKRWPQFDQRLITVVSDSSSNALLEHLGLEVQSVFSEGPVKTRVSLRPFAVPMLILIAEILILCL